MFVISGWWPYSWDIFDVQDFKSPTIKMNGEVKGFFIGHRVEII
jgi:hypothetical protein